MISGAEVRLSLLGWNFRTATVSVRERIAFTPEEIRDALGQLLRRGVFSECVIVSTCHRSEIYSVSAESEESESLTRFLSEWRGLDYEALAGDSFRRVGADAVRHLFRVAAGLESIALGESEVLGQVRQALRLAKESGGTRSVLHRLFESAVAAGKRVRAQTEIAVHPLSIPSIGFELATKVFGKLTARTVLVLGAGETGSLFARHAIEAGVGELRVANRSPERAAALASSVGGRAIPWDAWRSQLGSVDVVVGTTASPDPVVRRADVEEAMRERRGKPMFFLDLAVPHDVDPSVREIYNVFSYSVNDLETVASENRARRAREVPQAEAIVEEELAEFLSWLGNLSVVPTVTDLKRRIERIRDGELARIPEAERERFRAFADSLAAKFLHEPMRRLKSEADPGRRLDRAEAVRHLFDLDEEEGGRS
jgi:glutamyl-tRNA reductase